MTIIELSFGISATIFVIYSFLFNFEDALGMSIMLAFISPFWWAAKKQIEHEKKIYNINMRKKLGNKPIDKAKLD